MSLAAIALAVFGAFALSFGIGGTIVELHSL